MLWICYTGLALAGCQATRHLAPIPSRSTSGVTGETFYSLAQTMGWKQRDSLAMKEIFAGNMPAFNLRLAPIVSTYTDTLGQSHTATFFVTPDYLSIGSEKNFARIPLTPMAAQQIASRFNCFLPTKKMVDLVYQQAKIKLAPVPMYSYRDSSITMWQHHLIIEGQRRGAKGLIAGIKKDVINTKLLAGKTNRVAIYGWHQTDGKPIQPLYTGHVNWYVDYSHGIRLVSRSIKVDGQWMDYKTVFSHPLLHPLLTDEGPGWYEYSY